ncbi:hypothetical protein NQ318_005624 [Aromia moschata]|uniref:Uncharacterized protein n=1 Tax=Aromia moschata TaxID=1265417 RepID=A0AAV8X791_9CUCU|nr:hypothetical protein NQ318_005624 [Aromia moschata]
MAGHLGGSRAGSLSLEGAPLMGGQEHSDAHLNLPEESSLVTLARRNTKRNRSMSRLYNLSPKSRQTADTTSPKFTEL